jgi:D-galactarolactone isomerase
MTPFSSGTDRPSVALPADACDCHMHVFDSARTPVSGAVVSAPTATIDDYKRLQKRLGTLRHVLVQPSTYGTDNTLMVSALARQGCSARGVAVVDDSVGDAELRLLRDANVVGLRFNLVQAGATKLSMLDSLAPRLSAVGFHAQLHLPGQLLIDNLEYLSRLDIPIVLDHYARIHHVPAIAPSVQNALWTLLESGRVWVKLSAPYLSSQSEEPPYPDLANTIEALVHDFPERMLWATDWPHATETSKPDDAKMLDWFIDTVKQPKLVKQILVDNPAELYHFPQASANIG